MLNGYPEEEELRRRILNQLSWHASSGIDTASLDHNAVKARRGRPQQHGGGYLDSLIGFVRPWMRYEMPDHLVRFEFSDDMRVYAVTLMPEQNSSL